MVTHLPLADPRMCDNSEVQESRWSREKVLGNMVLFGNSRLRWVLAYCSPLGIYWTGLVRAQRCLGQDHESVSDLALVADDYACLLVLRAIRN